ARARPLSRPAVGARAAVRTGGARARLRADPLRARRPLALRPVARAATARGRAPARVFPHRRPRLGGGALRGRGRGGAPAGIAGGRGGRPGPEPDTVLLAGLVAPHRTRRPLAAASHRVLRVAAGRPTPL